MAEGPIDAPLDPYAGLPWPPPGYPGFAPQQQVTLPEYPLGNVIGSIPTNPPPAPPPPPPPPPQKIDEQAPISALHGVLPATPYVAPSDEGTTVTTEARQAPAATGTLGASADPNAIALPGAPPAFEPKFDALSGVNAITPQQFAGAQEQQQQQKDQQAVLAKWAHDPLNPQAGLDLTNEQRELLLQHMDPIERGRYEAHQDAIKGNEAIAARAAEATQNARRELEAYQDHQTAIAAARADSAKVQADAIALANKPVETWMQSRSTFQKIAAGLSAAFGAMGQAAGFKGGNVGLDMMNAAMRDHMESVRMDLENKRAVLGIRATGAQQKMQQASEDYRTLTVHNLALHQAALDGLTTEMQQYDPNGTVVRQAGDVAAQIQGQMAAIQQKYDADQLKQKLDIAKEARESRAQQEIARHNKVQEGIEYSKAATEKSKLGAVYTPNQLGQLLPAGAPLPPIPMSLTDYDKWAGAGEKGLSLAGKTGNTPKDVAERGVFVPAGLNPDGSVKREPLVQQDGKTPYAFPEKSAEKLKSRQGGYMQFVSALDDLRQLRSENGQDYNKWSAEAKAKAMEKERVLVGAHKAYGIEGFRGNVMEVMDKVVTGDTDPSSIMKVMPLLDRARRDAIAGFNSMLHDEGNYTGRDLGEKDFPDPVKLGKPEQTLTDVSLAKLKSSPAEDLDEASQALGIPKRDLTSGSSNEKALHDFAANGMLPQQQGTLDALEARWKDPALSDAQRAALRTQIEGVARDARSAAVRDAANNILVPTFQTEEPVGPVTHVERDEPPPKAKK